MKIETEERGVCALFRVAGRLDATWADFFASTLMEQVRKGRHWLVVDAQEMVFLSSAGIRAMMQVYKELNQVKGRFGVVNPADFVEQTLRSSGLGMWLDVDEDEIPPLDSDGGPESDDDGFTYYPMQDGVALKASVPASWRPWRSLEENTLQSLEFGAESVALGIGAPHMTDESHAPGEFLGVGGNVVFQPPQEQTPADYLLAEESFVPRLMCAQALHLQGKMAHLLRFAPAPAQQSYPLSQMLEQMQRHCGSASGIGFVILGEIEGLVGAHLIQSPTELKTHQSIGYPEVREWLSFCGERSHPGKQALIVGVALPEGSALVPDLAYGDKDAAGWSAAHMHAAVFPPQSLQNGKIEMRENVERFFRGAPPYGVMHLVNDKRAALGLGESALTRGACWFAPIQNPEVLV